MQADTRRESARSPLLAFLDSRAGRLMRWAISAGLVAVIVVQADWTRLLTLEGKFATEWVLLGVLLAGAAVPLHAWRWWLLLRGQGLALDFGWVQRVTWIATFYNSFLIGGAGGDAARVYHVCRRAPQQKAAGIAAIAIDRATGLMVLFLLAVVAVGLKARVWWSSPELRSLAVLAALGAAGGLGVAIFCAWYGPARWPRWVRAKIGAERLPALEEFHARLVQARAAYGWALAVGVVIWLSDFVAIWIFARAVELPFPLLDTCIAAALAYLATVLPISIGGHGVREGVLLFGLGLLGLLPDAVARDRALLVSVLVWATTMGWSLVGGGVLLMSGDREAKALDRG